MTIFSRNDPEKKSATSNDPNMEEKTGEAIYTFGIKIKRIPEV